MKRPHRGFTLVEMLAVMAVFSVTLSTAVLLLHALLQTGTKARDRLDAGIQLTRFTSQFRHDAHEATDVTTQPAETAETDENRPTVLRFQLPGEQQIEYRLLTDRIERVVSAGAGAVQVESFRVQPLIERGWSLTPGGASSLVSVFLQPSRDIVARDYHGLAPLRLDAAVGLVARASAASPESRLP